MTETTTDQPDAPDEITRLKEENARLQGQVDTLTKAFTAAWPVLRAQFTLALSAFRPILLAAGFEVPEWEVRDAADSRALLANVALVADNLDEAWRAADDDRTLKSEPLLALIESVQAAVLVLRGEDLPGEEDPE